MLEQLIGLGPASVGPNPRIVVTDDNAFGIGVVDHARAVGQKAGPGILGHGPFHARADQRLFAAQKRHSLTLHVGTHERAVGVVVFQEGNKGGRDGHDLAWRDVHQGDLLARHHDLIAAHTRSDHGVGKRLVRRQRGIGTGDDFVDLPGGVQIDGVAGKPAVLNDFVRRLDKAEVVDLGVGGQRHDQTDVRAFRRLNGADAAVVGGVHVAHLKTGPLAGKTARSKGRQTALVGDFGERIGLIHKLRELGGAEEFLEHRSHRLGIDQIMGHERGHFLQAHALFDGPLHAHQANAVLVFHQLADRTHPAVAQMVDVVGRAVGIL